MNTRTPYIIDFLQNEPALYVSRPEILLRDEAVFAEAEVIDWGAGLGWPGERDLSASTLWRMAEEQAPFSNADFVAWQERVGLSNREAADALGLSIRTIKNIRAEVVAVGNAVAIVCRAMEADPTVLAAHYAPRKPGRPKAA